MIDKTALLSMLETRGAVDSGRRKESPTVEDRGGNSHDGGRE